MNLYIVTVYPGWGHSINVVRAESPEQAQRIAAPHGQRSEVEELPDDGTAKLLWCHEDSPDTPPDAWE